MAAAAAGLLRDHRVLGRALLQASAMVEMVGLGLRMLLDDGLSPSFRDAAIIAPYFIPAADVARCA